MTTWCELPKIDAIGSRILLIAANKGLKAVEMAVLVAMVCHPKMEVYPVSRLWDYASPLPYTRQGVLKAIDSLVARGWAELGARHGFSYRFHAYSRKFRLLPVCILADAPHWLKPSRPQVTPVAEVPAPGERSLPRRRKGGGK